MQDVQKLFNDIAKNYDFLNNFISIFLHKIVKYSAVKKIKIKNGASVLDLCTGTGDIAFILSKDKNIKEITAVDFSSNMLSVAKKKNKSDKVKFVFANCLKLPFKDNSFDICTMAFGLRNIKDKKTALQEIARVLKPNGIFFHLDFSNTNSVADKFFDFTAPLLGKIFAQNKEAYEYLVKSKKNFLKKDELMNLFKENGLEQKEIYGFVLSVISSQICVCAK